jgi:adenylosuccinate lyase
MNKIDINILKINEDLNSSWEILAEPIMTVMRYHNVDNSYDIIKQATRGKEINQDIIKDIINKSDLKNTIKNKLLKLEPKDYIGLAKKLTIKKN